MASGWWWPKGLAHRWTNRVVGRTASRLTGAELARAVGLRAWAAFAQKGKETRRLAHEMRRLSLENEALAAKLRAALVADDSHRAALAAAANAVGAAVERNAELVNKVIASDDVLSRQGIAPEQRRNATAICAGRDRAQRSLFF